MCLAKVFLPNFDLASLCSCFGVVVCRGELEQFIAFGKRRWPLTKNLHSRLTSKSRILVRFFDSEYSKGELVFKHLLKSEPLILTKKKHFRFSLNLPVNFFFYNKKKDYLHLTLTIQSFDYLLIEFHTSRTCFVADFIADVFCILKNSNRIFIL